MKNMKGENESAAFVREVKSYESVNAIAANRAREKSSRTTLPEGERNG